MLRALARPPIRLHIARALTVRGFTTASGGMVAEQATAVPAPSAAQPPPPLDLPAPAQQAPAAPPPPPLSLPQPGESILLAAQRVLRASSPADKAALSDAACALFQAGQLTLPPAAGGPPLPPDLPPVPAKPARDGRVTVLPPGKIKRLKAGGTVASRAAILHSLAHIENWAVDIFFDIIAR
jgi:hypothetical protein